ncbi:hypothetical protein P7K49_028320 [Saguinus oedipus]|uniref:Thymidylate synthase n=1 Tax=Saguinus oedipus TaxID=9490 RepID=A0ABQ9UE48_SAGOE|nr:hypothetical protein P7K49_028320 [Saguinus oedipus]
MPVAGSELPRQPSQPAAQELDAQPRPPHGELQYLGQIEHILRCGVRKDDRTGTGTLSVFGMQARYSLRGNRRQGGRRGWGERLGAAGRCGPGFLLISVLRRRGRIVLPALPTPKLRLPLGT